MQVNVRASYTHDNTTKIGVKNVSIVNVKELTGLVIQGPVSLSENDTGSFTAVAQYSDNTSSPVSANVTWSIDSAYASIDNGNLTSVSVTRNQSAVLTASYSEEGKVVVSEPFSVTIIDLGLGLVDLVIDGPASIDENGQASYVARAVYDDGSDAVVDAVWNENSAFASVDATGAVNTSDVSTDQAFSLSAQYTANNVTHNAKRNLTLLDTDANVGVTARVSIDTNEVESNGESGMPSVSLDGRYVAFESVASNLDINSTDVDGLHDVFIRDRQQGTTELISVVAGGVQADGLSRNPSISGDGQLVAFESELTSAFTVNNIFVRDLTNTLTEHVSFAVGGETNGDSYNPSISSDGRYVVFESVATNLTTTNDTNGVSDIFIHDRNMDETSVITVGAFLPNGTSHSPVVSEYGAFVAFSSDATNLVYGDENNASDIFVYERSIGALTRVSVDTQGHDLGGDAENPSISGDGRYVAFELHFIDSLTSERTGNSAIFIRDRHTGFTTRLKAEGEAYAGNMRLPSVSFDGRMIAFEHEMSGDASAANGSWAVSVYDQNLETVRLLALNSDGVAANDDSIQAVPNSDGTMFAFTSSANNLVVDGNLVADVFSRVLPPAVKVNKLSLLPVAPAVLATDQVVVDLVMDFGVDVTLGGGLEVLYDNSLLNFVSFVPDIALADDPVFRAFIAPEVLNDGGLQNGVISFGDFDGLSGTRKIGTFTFSPKSSSTVGIAHISLVNNVAPYGGFYGSNTYVGQPVKYEDTTVSIGVDTDGDGYVNSLDAFPDDLTEWADTDGDGLGDNQEIALGTDPNSSDSDNDSIIDSVEVALGTIPVSVDSDGDTISDIDELNLAGC